MRFWGALAFALSAFADPIQFSDSDSGLQSSVSLVQNGSATDIQLQMFAPQNAGWGAVGVGSQMAGALMFVMYPSASGQGVTVSVRSATGHVMPTVVPDLQYQVTNSSIGPDGRMMAAFTCYGCTHWSGGSLDTTSSQQAFIYALGPGDTIQSDDPNARIEQHSQKGMFMGNAASALTTASNGATQSPPPIAPGSSNTNAESSMEPDDNLVKAHAVLLCLVFFLFLPSGVIMLRLPFTKSAAYPAHWMTQMLGLILAIAGLVIAIYFSKNSGFSDIDLYHQIIGIIVIALLIIQPLGGLLHHVQYKKVMRRGVVSYGHIGLGWIIIFLGMLNGTFGLHLAENDKGAGGLGAAGIVILLAMLGVSLWGTMGRRNAPQHQSNKNDMELLSSKERRTEQ